VGVSEQDASFFSDPLFTKLKVKRGRYFPSWNVALKKREAAWLDIWVSEAQRTGVEPLISFTAALGSRCPKRPCKLPSVKQYKKAFKAFRKRWPQVKVVNPWNEANHRSQPTFRNPKRAAQYYNVVRSSCRGCKIVAADVIDERNMESWLKTFRRYAKKPKIWGLHNYRDTNLRKGQVTGGTRRLVRAVKGQIWLDREVHPAERGQAVQVLGEPRQQGDQADVQARQEVPLPRQAPLHLQLAPAGAEQPLRRRSGAAQRQGAPRLQDRAQDAADLDLQPVVGD
jgi:hypothetical protein